MASADTLSPVYPDRPIRPLPKNRLKSRLSPEQSASLIYPPDPPISSLSFNFPFGAADKADGRGAVNGGHAAHYGDQVTHCTCGAEHGEESDEDEIVFDHPNFRVQSPVEGVQQRRMLGEQRAVAAAAATAGGTGTATAAGAAKPAPPASTASSADGYESFENTSNKKKRKIPLSASSAVHQSSLTAELANMGISSHGLDGTSDDASAHAATSYPSATGMGHAGAGRGRAGKSSPMRGRERVSISHVANAYPYAGVEQSVERGGAYKGDGTKIHAPAQEHRIISNAIANAQSQPTTPQKGRENVSLLSLPSPKSATPKTQFTFTCESDSSNKMLWPGHPQPPYSTPVPTTSHHQSYPIAPSPAALVHANTTQGTQTNLPMRGPNTAAGAMNVPQANAAGNPAGNPAPRRPRRRRPSREYAHAARERRLQQEYNNYHHKPTKDNMWICEFCEYEDIWGVPPLALIRQYEIKDRAERKKAEEKRRLLEKAKMKGRKGKKNVRGKNNGAAAANQTSAHQGAQQYDHNGDPIQNPPHSQDGQDDYFDDDYDDGYDPVEPHDSGGGGGGGGGAPPHQMPDRSRPGVQWQFANDPPPPPDKVVSQTAARV
ncbi:hypothetical protein AAFC00_000803 [Neodothiora populina]|uniref:Uncharacterized protein n=1 Tax=Neodothiora populina TaxID=2781224 RepID=A0ABR3PLS5_9PEZI